jgi:putative ABC transport system permease protein
MMATRALQNRQMFWRILRRLLSANRGRLFVILLALGAGAAVTAALLNLQVDAKHRLTSEFRAFGANLIVTPSSERMDYSEKTLDDSLAQHLPPLNHGMSVTAIPLLYLVADVAGRDWSASTSSIEPIAAVVVGFGQGNFDRVMPSESVETASHVVFDLPECFVGQRAAAQLKVHAEMLLNFRTKAAQTTCHISIVKSFGGPGDHQIFINLDAAQRLAGLRGRASMIVASVPGSAAEVHEYVANLQRQLPEADVRPIRQFTEGEAKIYGRISGLLTATVVVVLVLTSLCVMAAMTNVAMERKNDVGLMKAIGGAARRVLRLFLAEAALLGLAGGIIGAAVGIFFSIYLGKQVFGVAAQPRLIVYPVAVALTIIVAILSAYPLRRLATVRPASVFRGEA